mmetsp:Transcript_44957/g.97665  ORF Transcript_44957/g.97665 Transcript_44957/m.97665 type:complete len:214 (+) Transcript_44957:130-771(+)
MSMVRGSPRGRALLVITLPVMAMSVPLLAGQSMSFKRIPPMPAGRAISCWPQAETSLVNTGTGPILAVIDSLASSTSSLSTAEPSKSKFRGWGWDLGQLILVKDALQAAGEEKDMKCSVAHSSVTAMLASSPGSIGARGRGAGGASGATGAGGCGSSAGFSSSGTSHRTSWVVVGTGASVVVVTVWRWGRSALVVVWGRACVVVVGTTVVVTV